MTEIKFRTWIKPIHRMTDVVGWCCEPDGRIGIEVVKVGRKLTNNKDDLEFWWKDSEAVVMEYTGLKDVDGKDIYEGDLVIKPANKQIFLEVVFADDIGCFEAINSVGARALGGYVNSADGVLIIGNIHENKEMLEMI